MIKKALEKYLLKVRKRQADAKARSFKETEWEVPLARDYDAETNSKVPEIEYHALVPFVRENDASDPQKRFESFLEANREFIDWWYKNGDSGQEHFAVPYTNVRGEKALFYVDYVVRMKSGKVYLFDTKTAGSDKEMVNKHNALVGYMKGSANGGRDLSGGIIVEESGLWRYPVLAISSAAETAGWESFVPAETQAGGE